jgi:hypothetical protein
MFGDIQSDNEDDFVMPVDNEPVYNDSPDAAEDSKLEETPRDKEPREVHLQAFIAPAPEPYELSDHSDHSDSEMEDAESPLIKKSILDEHFMSQLRRVEGNHSKLV